MRAQSTKPNPFFSPFHVFGASHNHTTFTDPQHVDLSMKGKTLPMLKGMICRKEQRVPPQPLEAVSLNTASFKEPEALQSIWLGHSSVLLEVDGLRILTDPVFDNAAPFGFMVKRFQPTPLTREALPPIDIVLISHDHYDHLEMKSMHYFAHKNTHFIVPQGVKAHLLYWGVPQEKITQLAWWEAITIGAHTFTCTPAKHFSGRGFRDRNKTLWASWAIQGPNHSVYFSGDSGYGSHFKEIGKRLGGFDVTLMEIGAYNELWKDVHMLPGEPVQAHIDLQGKVMFPIHWGTFNLSFHAWDDPLILNRKIALEKGVAFRETKLGERLF